MSTIVPRYLFLSILFTLIFAVNAIAVNIPNSSSDIQRITIAELQTLQASGETVIFIDTRNPSQWQRAKDKIPGAIRVTTQNELQTLQSEASPDTEIVTYCT